MRKEEPAASPLERPFGELDSRAREVYAQTLTSARELLSSAGRPYIDKSERFIGLAELLARELRENPVILRYTSYSTADDYLYAHSANVAVISQAAGLAKGLGKEELGLLGFCALAHDIGMTAHAELANSERRLTDSEYDAVMLHSEEGAEKVERMLGLTPRFKERARKIILQVHERIDGEGYPGRLTNAEIDPLAQIIGIVDVYEAMTHPRAWRPAAHPHEVLKHLIDKEGKGFDSIVVKAVMKALSIYPPGSLVSLSGGEIAEVVKVNRQSLTRPLVSVLLDRNFSPAPPHLINLMEHPLASIEDAVEESVLAVRNPKFAAQRELARWWMDW